MIPVHTKWHMDHLRREAVRCGGDESEAERVLFAWYAAVASGWEGKPPPGDNPFAFWDKRYAEWRGVSASQATAKTATFDVAAWAAKGA